MEVYIQLDPRSRPTLERRGQRERDLVAEFSICREHGRSLRGAAPRELIAHVPHEWVIHVGDQQLADWQSLTDDAGSGPTEARPYANAAAAEGSVRFFV